MSVSERFPPGWEVCADDESRGGENDGMSDVAECPHCGRQLRVPEAVLGRAVKCPACATTFTAGEVPSNVAPVPAAPIPFRDEPPRAPAEDPRHDDYLPRRRRRDLVPHRGGMVLTFGILSLCCGCLGNLIFGPIAWTMGNTDLTEIRAGRMDPEGEGLTQAGRICGMVGTGLGVLGLCWVGLTIVASSLP